MRWVVKHYWIIFTLMLFLVLAFDPGNNGVNIKNFSLIKAFLYLIVSLMFVILLFFPFFNPIVHSKWGWMFFLFIFVVSFLPSVMIFYEISMVFKENI